MSGGNAMLGDLKVKLWRNVLANTVWALRAAETNLKSADRYAYFSGKSGWWRAKPVGGVKIPSETAVSEALVEEIERIVRVAVGQGLDRVSTLGFGGLEQLCFTVEQPRAVKVGIGDKSKPTDIRVYRAGGTLIDLRIEAKTILTPAEIKAEYMSARGLLRFCDPLEPYTIEPYGGMLAYTVSGTSSEWCDNIRTELESALGARNVARERFHVGQSETLTCELERPAYLDPDGVIGVVPAGPVCVFHMALELTTEPSPEDP